MSTLKMSLLTEDFPCHSLKVAVQEIVKSKNICNFTVHIKEYSEKGNNYLGVLYPLSITGENNNKEMVILNLIAKTPTKTLAVREKVPVTQYFITEAYFYNKLVSVYNELYQMFSIPLVDRFPLIECQIADSTFLNEVIVMEDLNHDGFTMCDRKIPLNLEHVTLVMQNIARLHALSFAIRKNLPDTYKEISETVEMNHIKHGPYKEFINLTMKNVLKILNDVYYTERLRKYSRDAFEVLLSCMEPATAVPYTVICHGDMWANNILFQYKDGKLTDLRFVDWQMMKHCSPLVDLSHLIFSSVEDGAKLEHYYEILEVYYASLAAHLQLLHCDIHELYPRHVFEQQVQSIFHYGIIISMVSINLATKEDGEVLDLDLLATTDIKGLMEIDNSNSNSLEVYRSRVKSLIDSCVKLKLL